jgi:titin
MAATKPATTCTTTFGGPQCTGGLGEICVNLSWIASTTQGATYDVYRGSTSGGESIVPIAQNLTGTTYQDDALPINISDLYYDVVAFAGGQSSFPSNEACAQVPTAVAPATGAQATGQHN